MKFIELFRMKMSTTGTGGPLTVSTAVSGFLGLTASGAVDGDVISYGIKDGANSEIGWGVVGGAATTITRNPTRSTNSNAAISLTANAEVYGIARNADLICATSPGYDGVGMINGKIVVTAGSNALGVAIKSNISGNDPSASDPVDFIFPTSTGGFTIIRLTAALSLTVPSTANLGVTAGEPFRLWVFAVNDAGTIRLGIVNCTPDNSSIITFALLEETVNTTLLDTASDAGQTLYTNVAVTGGQLRILGYLEWTSTGITVSGTWSVTNLTRVQLMGPGVPRPGDVVQILHLTNTTSTGATTTTPVSTNLSLSATLRNPCNVWKIEVSGSARMVGLGNLALVGVYKTGVLLTRVSEMIIEADNDSIIVPGSMVGFDVPRASGAIVYDVRIWVSGGTSTATWNSAGGNATMTMTELMA